MSNKMPSRAADEIQLDINDIESVISLAKRQKTKDLLTLELRKLQTELINLKEKELNDNEPSKSIPNSSASKCYTVKLTNYAWDESDKFMKLYITLKNVHTVPADNITCDFNDRSVHLRVFGLDNKNYELPISNLCDDINPDKSYTKSKTDMIVVFLMKKSPKLWSHVTEIEKRIKEGKAPLVPEVGGSSDPEPNLMNLIKKMYMEGDDQIKRSIAKAWTEGQDKRGSPGLDFPSM
ncbi:calcyclin-binding protein [Fopius arisanus]|uniref:Calcyclin-binding protein n=1 Tax=Fopius arisanus TaxID=64838 RepID=A0A9R1U0C9_9HYME|nr:PREDICTED: calcyclin-binding protein [Fopius arisanus]